MNHFASDEPLMHPPVDPVATPLEGLQAGERVRAMSELFRDHNRALVGFLVTRLQSEEEAKEIAQEAYVRLLQLHEPVATGFLRWYLFKIAKDLAIDRHRQRITRTRLDRMDGFGELDTSSPTESTVMARDELAALHGALQELPSKCRQAFLLHRFEDLSTVEIGQRMGLTDRMVRKHIKRALIYCRLRLSGIPKEAVARQVNV